MGKIRRRHCKERLKIITIAKFESNLLKAYGDRAPRSCEIFQTFCRDGHWCWGASLGAQFSQIYLGSRKTYTNYVSLTALIFGNVTNLKALFPLWCRPIFPNWSVSKIEKTVFRQRTPRSTVWTPGTGYGRVDWNRSWYPSLLAGKRYSDTVFNIGSDLPVDQCDATFNSFLAHSILGDPGAVSRVDKMSTRLTRPWISEDELMDDVEAVEWHSITHCH